MAHDQTTSRLSISSRRLVALVAVVGIVATLALLFAVQCHWERGQLQDQFDSLSLASQHLSSTAESALLERKALMNVITLMAENQLDTTTLYELLPDENARATVLAALRHNTHQMHRLVGMSVTLEETEALLRTTVQLLEERTIASQRTVDAQRDSLREAANEMYHLRRALDVTSAQLTSHMKSNQKLAFTKNGARVTYFGEVDDGKANGRGTGLWSTGGTYEGLWKDNLRHGQGVYVWADGERYEGTFVEGKRSGYGIYTFKNGEQYKGEWLDDKRHGIGVHLRANGDTVVVGRWASDRFKERHRAPLLAE